MSRLNLKKGDSRALFILSLVNFLIYAVWFVAYIVCLMLRASAFSSAQASMAISGQTNYTVEVTSPFFGVLRFFIYLLPVLLLAWLVALLVADKKKKDLCDSKIIVAVFGIDTVCAVMTALDIFSAHMLF